MASPASENLTPSNLHARRGPTVAAPLGMRSISPTPTYQCARNFDADPVRSTADQSHTDTDRTSPPARSTARPLRAAFILDGTESFAMPSSQGWPLDDQMRPSDAPRRARLALRAPG